MPRTRVYLPVTGADLTALARDRVLSAPRSACAVTRALEQAQRGADEEELEYLALQQAASDAVPAAADAGERVAVAAADVEPEGITGIDTPAGQLPPGRAACSVTVSEQVALARIASFHLADDVAVQPPASSDDPAEQEAEEMELSWYDVTELSLLVDLVTGTRRP